MINFRYHIVSLMAVFLALAVGIAVGVTLSPSVQRGIATQAQQDRDQVTALRSELDRRNNLDSYRDAYDQRTASLVLSGELADTRVAIVAMPDAPGSVVSGLAGAVEKAGGRVVSQVKVSAQVFDPAQGPAVDEAVAGLGPAGLTDTMSPATKVGWSLGRAITSKQVTVRDEYARSVGVTLASARLVDVREDVDDYAQLVVVVAAPTPTTAPATEVTTAHVQLQTALREQGGTTDRVAVVVAGPNSAGLTGTDVGAIRTTSPASSELSTVDVADLPSGLVTTVLAGTELVVGRQARHYGALPRADDALPTLPVR